MSDGDMWVWDDLVIMDQILNGNINNMQQQLYALIAAVMPIKERLHRPFWKPNLVSGYTAKTGYDMVVGSVFSGDTNDGVAKAFNAMLSTCCTLKFIINK